MTPTFSLIIETENLANGASSDLERCLSSIAAQDFGVHHADRVILVDTGQVDPATVEGIRSKYPWVHVHVAPGPLHYYEAKLAGARLVTSDVIVFADADMVYERDWLGALLKPFERADVEFVSGETRIEIRGPYTFSVATTWLFPVQYSAPDAPSLFANNAAVRRPALLNSPFPSAGPLFRAQVVLHGTTLRRKGRTILNAPARGFHAPPAGLREWALRFAVAGADCVLMSTYDVDADGRVVHHSTAGRRLVGLWRSCARKVGSAGLRTIQALWQRPSRFLFLPAALPISCAALLLFVGGGLTAVLESQIVYRRMRAFEAAATGARRTHGVPAPLS